MAFRVPLLFFVATVHVVLGLVHMSHLTLCSRSAPSQTRLALDLGKGVSLGQLWLELLRFYTLEFALEERIISIRLKELLSREMKNWPRRRLAIEGKTAGG